MVGRGCYTLELFHGPTCAFKGFRRRFMGRMTGLLGAADEKLVILHGHLGRYGQRRGAHGFLMCRASRSVVLYPEGKISRLQGCQMTALGATSIRCASPERSTIASGSWNCSPTPRSASGDG